MKLAAVAAAALLAVAPAAAPVSYEAQGIRVAGELVVGPQLVLKGIEAGTLLVSGSAVENLGAPVDVALDASHALKLETGLRLERRANGFLLTSHGPALVLDLPGRALQAGSSVAFTLTPVGFDFAALGAVEGASFAVRTAAPGGQDGGLVSPERNSGGPTGSRITNSRRVFKGGNSFVAGAGADRQVLTGLVLLSLDGSK